MSNYSKSNAHEASLKFAKEELEKRKVIECIIDEIQYISKYGGDNYISASTLFEYILIKEYFENLYYCVSILSKEPCSSWRNQTIVKYKIEW